MQDPRRGPLAQMPGGGAPNAGRPGTGTGNVPYAKGMLSGQFGPQGQQSARPAPAPVAAASPRPAGPPPPPSGGGPTPMGPPPPGPGQQNPFLDPMFYFDVMGSIMGALVQAANSDTPFY